MNSSAASRDQSPERRHDHAERLRSAAAMLDSDTDFETIRPYVDSVLGGVADRLARFAHDELANTVFDMVLDVDMHTCVGGRYCFVCEQGRMEREA